MARYHTTGRATETTLLQRMVGTTVFEAGRCWGSYVPLVSRSLVSRFMLRIRRSRWLEIDVPETATSAPQRWAISVTNCDGETDTGILEGAQAHVRAELEILETLVQWRRDVPTVSRPAPWSYRLPAGTHEPCVYFMRNGTRVKIGTTTQLRNRVRRLALRPENVALVIPGDRDTEQAMHQRFASQRVGDTEWFAETGALREYIETSRMEQRS